MSDKKNVKKESLLDSSNESRNLKTSGRKQMPEPKQTPGSTTKRSPYATNYSISKESPSIKHAENSRLKNVDTTRYGMSPKYLGKNSEQNEYTKEDLKIISRKVPREDFRILARFLNLTTKHIEELENKCQTMNYNDECLNYEMLRLWQRTKGRDATRNALIDALKESGLSDISDEVYPKLWTENDILKISRRISRDEQKPFAKCFGLTEQRVEKIQKDCTEKRCGDAEIVYQILQACKPQPTKMDIIKACKVIGRRSLADEVFAGYRVPSLHPLTAIQKSMQEKQKQHFINLRVPPFLRLREKRLLLEELFMGLTVTTKNEKGEGEERMILKEEIFERDENRFDAIHRILVEGKPETGKTVLVLRLLTDWSNGHTYICKKFDLAFVIQLRNYEGDLSTHLLQQCREVEGSDDEKLQAIKAIENRVLLFLDGLDEAPENVKESLLPLLTREDYPTMTVVVTSRTGVFQLTTQNNEDLNSTSVRNLDRQFVWDKHIKIKGISKDHWFEILHNHLKIDSAALTEKLSVSDAVVSDFFKNPIFLSLLTDLVQEKKVMLGGTKTEFCKTIFNYVINRSLIQEELLEKEFEVFNTESIDGLQCQNMLIQFGKLCLEKFKTRTSVFERNELLDCLQGYADGKIIIKFGFLSREISFYKEKRENYFKIIYKNAMEFLSALYLSSLGENDIEREIQELLIKCDIWPQENQVLYPFLGGLLQSNAIILFNIFSHYKGLISIFNDGSIYSVESILLEIPPTTEIINSLSSFQVGNWGGIKYDASLRNWYIGVSHCFQKHGFKEYLSLRIPQNLGIIDCLPKTFKVNNMVLDVETLEMETNIIDLENIKIQCKNLFMQLVVSVHGFPNILKELLSRINAEKIWLKMDYENLQSQISSKRKNVFYFLKEMVEGVLQFNLYYLSIHKMSTTQFEIISSHLSHLLKNERITYGLNISISSDVKANKLVRSEVISITDIVSNCQLKSFGLLHFFNDPLPSPLFGPNKVQKRNFLGLRGRFKGINIDEMKIFSVKHFYCIHLNLENRILLSKLLMKCKDINRLTCHTELFADLFACDSEWEGFETIERLDVKIGWNADVDCVFLSGISRFHNVRELYLILTFASHRYNHLLLKLFSSSSSLKKFSLYLDIPNSYQFIMEFLPRLSTSEIKPEDSHRRLEEFQIEGLPMNIYSSMDFITCLQSCFYARVFSKFSTLDKAILHDFMFIKHFLSKSEFKVFSRINEEFSVYRMFSSGFDEFPELNQKITITYSHLTYIFSNRLTTTE